MEKILKCLTEENKDVRKGTWTNKEVSCGHLQGLLSTTFLSARSILLLPKPHARVVHRARQLVSLCIAFRFSPASLLLAFSVPLYLTRKGERPDLTQLVDVGSRPNKNEMIVSSDSSSFWVYESGLGCADSYRLLPHRRSSLNLYGINLPNRDIRYSLSLFSGYGGPRPHAPLRSFSVSSSSQVEIINGLTLLTAKPITYLVNLSERDFVRKKNKWLAKIKSWIDEHNPGDALIPFSVSLEERLVKMSEEEKVEEAEKLGLPKGNPSGLGKITTAGYASLELIRYFTCEWY